jgi:hypothetical protein
MIVYAVIYRTEIIRWYVDKASADFWRDMGLGYTVVEFTLGVVERAPLGDIE